MKNNRILQLAFVCLVMAAMISVTPQGWYTPSINDGRQCPSYCY